MKIRVDRRFPYCYITGICLYQEFDFKLPEKRADIMRKKRDPEFVEKVNVIHQSFPYKLDQPESYRQLAKALGVKIQIRVENNDIITYGTGKYKYYSLQ